MLNEKLSNDLFNIMPEDFYHNTLRKDFIDTLSKVKFDPILVLTVEEVMNKADSSSVNKEYEQLTEDLQPLAIALLSDTYQKSDSFIRADEEEKIIVRRLIKNIQELLTITKCTKSPKKKENRLNRPRLNYDIEKKQNIISDSKDVITQKQRIPNIK